MSADQSPAPSSQPSSQPSRPPRVIVAAVGADPDALAMRVARDRLGAGHEVIYLGDGLGAEQVARSAVAEDAVEVVVNVEATGAVHEALAMLGIDDVSVTPLAR